LKSVLVIEDEHLLLWALVKRFRKAGFEAEGCESAEEGLQVLENQPMGLVVLDLRLPRMDGMQCLKEIRTMHPQTAVVMMTAHGDIGSAVEAMRLGAYNYLTKPFDFREVLAIAETLLGDPGEAVPAPPVASHVTRTAPVGAPRKQTRAAHAYAVDSLLGASASMQQVKALTRKVAASSTTTVLLTGESGTGKDHLAKVIHYSSPRAQAPFVHVNVTSLAPTLFESELFGHERGAFTGAHARKKGLLTMAQGGTLYLDEIGDLDPGLQSDLLHVLEERSFKRVGGVENLAVDVRFIAATNSDLRSKVSEGTFRRDLYYRLRVVPIELPPLRERDDDVIILAQEFLRRCAESFQCEMLEFEPDALSRLRNHTWPGNVRELRNVIERACVLGEGRAVTADMLVFEELIPSAQQAGDPVSLLSDSGMNLEEVERNLIQAALERSNGSQIKAAEILGLGRDALRYRMKKHDLL
jgi:DNA-binding NtrC family response regulator